jgi:hypothetical protein
MMAVPQRAPLKPEDYPEFTREVQARVPNSAPVFPFGTRSSATRPRPSSRSVPAPWILSIRSARRRGHRPGLGDNEFTHASVVSREATITVPDIGQVVLNGLTLAQAKR